VSLPKTRFERIDGVVRQGLDTRQCLRIVRLAVCRARSSRAKHALFPNGKYDDQIDSTSQALAWTKQRPSDWGILEYYRQQVENMRNPPERWTMVGVKPPTQFSNLYTMSGRNILPRPDGSFEVSLEDAKPLLMAGWQQISDAA
jgi:hypothetical protein